MQNPTNVISQIWAQSLSRECSLRILKHTSLVNIILYNQTIMLFRSRMNDEALSRAEVFNPPWLNKSEQ